MKKSGKKILSFAIALIMSVTMIAHSGITAYAASDQNVKITYNGQIVDTFNGVSARYIPGTGNSNSGTYCCAQYVKNYYKAIYGITVSNLLSNRTPNVSESGYVFKVISTDVKPGDIVRFPSHWAIVKSVSGNTLTLIEQNWKWADKSGVTYAKVNRTVSLGSNGMVVFRLYKDGQDIHTPVSSGVKYETHLENTGWTSPVYNGQTSGTTGMNKQMEAIKISLQNISGGISYRTHVSNIGWMDWVSNGAVGGTTGCNLQMEAVQIKLTGAAANQYSVMYRVHVGEIGWMDWQKDGAVAGTTGRNLQIEAIEIKLVSK